MNQKSGFFIGFIAKRFSFGYQILGTHIPLKTFGKKNFSLWEIFLSSSASAESILNRQLMEKLERHIFYFKNNASQPKNFFEKSQNFRHFFAHFQKNPELSVLPCLYEGYKKIYPPRPGAETSILWVRIALSRKLRSHSKK